MKMKTHSAAEERLDIYAPVISSAAGGERKMTAQQKHRRRPRGRDEVDLLFPDLMGAY